MGQVVDSSKIDSIVALRLSLSFPSRWTTEKLLKVLNGDFTDCSPDLADTMGLRQEYEQYQSEKNKQMQQKAVNI